MGAFCVICLFGQVAANRALGEDEANEGNEKNEGNGKNGNRKSGERKRAADGRL
jgi:hypothetical protein